MTNQEFIESISLPNEEWRDVVGYEGYYMVSSFGRVMSLPRMINNCKGYRLSKHRILSPRLSSGGYYQVAFAINNDRTQPHIHKLVAEAFIPNPNNYPQADHIDCNKLNNRAENLRWCTQKMNNENPITKARRKTNIHLTAQKIREAKSKPVVRISQKNENDIKIYPSATYAEIDGYNQSSISANCLRKYKQHRGYKWMYLSDYENLVNKSKNSLPNPN